MLDGGLHAWPEPPEAGDGTVRPPVDRRARSRGRPIASSITTEVAACRRRSGVGRARRSIRATLPGRGRARSIAAAGPHPWRGQRAVGRQPRPRERPLPRGDRAAGALRPAGRSKAAPTSCATAARACRPAPTCWPSSTSASRGPGSTCPRGRVGRPTPHAPPPSAGSSVLRRCQTPPSPPKPTPSSSPRRCCATFVASAGGAAIAGIEWFEAALPRLPDRWHRAGLVLFLSSAVGDNQVVGRRAGRRPPARPRRHRRGGRAGRRPSGLRSGQPGRPARAREGRGAPRAPRPGRPPPGPPVAGAQADPLRPLRRCRRRRHRRPARRPPDARHVAAVGRQRCPGRCRSSAPCTSAPAT